MAEKQLTDLHRAKRGVAILTTCIVQTLNETDPTFKERFLSKLSVAYDEVRDALGGDVIQELELLTWTREYLTGFNLIDGQGQALLDR